MSAAPPVPPLRQSWCVRRSGRFVASQTAVVFSDDHGQIAAADVATGARRWTYPWQAKVLAVHEDFAFLGLSGGEMHLVALGSGRPEGCVHGASFEAAVPEGARLVGHLGAHPDGVDRVRAVDWRSGRTLWTHALPPSGRRFSDRGVVQIATTAEAAIVLAMGATVCAIGLSDGDVLWSRPAAELYPRGQEAANSAPYLGNLCMAGQRVLLATRDRWIALDAGDGSLLWRSSKSNGWPGRLDMLSGRSYHLFDPVNGRPAKLALRPSSADSDQGRWLATGSHLFTTSSLGLRAFDLATGREVFHQDVSFGSPPSELAAAGDRLLVATNGLLCCFTSD